MRIDKAGSGVGTLRVIFLLSAVIITESDDLSFCDRESFLTVPVYTSTTLQL